MSGDLPDLNTAAGWRELLRSVLGAAGLTPGGLHARTAPRSGRPPALALPDRAPATAVLSGAGPAYDCTDELSGADLSPCREVNGVTGIPEGAVVRARPDPHGGHRFAWVARGVAPCTTAATVSVQKCTGTSTVGPADGAALVIKQGATTVASCTVGPTGSCTFSLAPGDYTAEATLSGTTETAEFSVVECETTQVSILLFAPYVDVKATWIGGAGGGGCAATPPPEITLTKGGLTVGPVAVPYGGAFDPSLRIDLPEPGTWSYSMTRYGHNTVTGSPTINCNTGASVSVSMTVHSDFVAGFGSEVIPKSTTLTGTSTACGAPFSMHWTTLGGSGFVGQCDIGGGNCRVFRVVGGNMRAQNTSGSNCDPANIGNFAAVGGGSAVIPLTLTSCTPYAATDGSGFTVSE